VSLDDMSLQTQFTNSFFGLAQLHRCIWIEGIVHHAYALHVGNELEQ